MSHHIYCVNLNVIIFLFIGHSLGCFMFWNFLGIFFVKFVSDLKCILNNKKTKYFENLFH